MNMKSTVDINPQKSTGQFETDWDWRYSDIFFLHLLYWHKRFYIIFLISEIFCIGAIEFFGGQRDHLTSIRSHMIRNKWINQEWSNLWKTFWNSLLERTEKWRYSPWGYFQRIRFENKKIEKQNIKSKHFFVEKEIIQSFILDSSLTSIPILLRLTHEYRCNHVRFTRQGHNII